MIGAAAERRAGASVPEVVGRVLARHPRRRSSLLDVAREVRDRLGWVPPEAVTAMARGLDLPRVDVEGFVSFYAFLHQEPMGRTVIRLCDDVVDRMHGYGRVREAFRRALGIDVGETTPDGAVSLTRTACIGLSDQAPAALVGDVPVTHLSAPRVRDVVRGLSEHGDPARLVERAGDGNNGHALVRSMVENRIMEPGPLVLGPLNRGEAVGKAVAMSPRQVIRTVQWARLRGRGGAGFPTATKWETTRAAAGERKYVICNADEGEPGTFKDRVLLTEFPDRVVAGMTIAGYAVGAREGILYLRAEYAYLLRFLEEVLERRRADGLLGRDVAGKGGFHFDVRIQLGAGAYVCGEETALLNSVEGRRGDARARPPFPAAAGLFGCPTSVNNVETLCCVTRILELDAATFAAYGTAESTGTKLLCLSGDCLRPGTYELPWGVSLREVLERAGAEGAGAVQVGGPSGVMVGPDRFHRRIGFEDLPTGGAMIVFGPHRDLLSVVEGYLEFFADESCGYCTPCRVGTELLLRYLDRVRAGRADAGDLEQVRRVAGAMKAASRCGLGQTACNPVLTSLANLPEAWAQVVRRPRGSERRSFELGEAVSPARAVRTRGNGGGPEPEVEP